MPTTSCRTSNFEFEKTFSLWARAICVMREARFAGRAVPAPQAPQPPRIRCRWRSRLVLAACVLAILSAVVALPACDAAEPTAAAVAGFNTYIDKAEQRDNAQHRPGAAYLAGMTPQVEARLRNGEVIVERLTPDSPPNLPGAMLHDWRATAFARGATAADVERLMKNFSAYPRIFAPQIMRAQIVAGQGDRLQTSMRIRQKHVITVVMDASYDVVFARVDAQHGSSISRSTRIAEIDAPGTPSERALSGSEEHGFLWRMNTYWSYEERDGGVYLQIESVSLTRSIPTGLGWAIGPFVESVPRESLEFTLRSTCNALRK